MTHTFNEFRKVPRLNREMTITEKIDGTNAQIVIGENGEFLTGSRNRYITPEDDNFGFSAWAHEHREELMQLGRGTHFGEWWGRGIQRSYGLQERRFSLFNTFRFGQGKPVPNCCSVVPVLYHGPFDTQTIRDVMASLAANGSAAAPGFANPEGVMVYHHAAEHLFKVTILGDESRKSAK